MIRALDIALRGGLSFDIDPDALIIRLPLSLPTDVRRRIGADVGRHAPEMARFFAKLDRTAQEKGRANDAASETISTTKLRGKDRAKAT